MMSIKTLLLPLKYRNDCDLAPVKILILYSIFIYYNIVTTIQQPDSQTFYFQFFLADGLFISHTASLDERLNIEKCGKPTK